MTIEDKDGDGEFDEVTSIPATFGAEHTLSFTIDFGDMAMSYDFTDTSEENTYGWGNSFDGENNKITLTNNSTCFVYTYIILDINTTTYQCLHELSFGFTETNENGTRSALIGTYKFLSYAGNQTEGAMTSDALYLNFANTDELADMHNYNFNNATIGEITISLEPVLETIPTEKGYYVKVTELSDPDSFLSVLTEFGYNAEEYIPIFLPVYFGAYETEDEANSLKTKLDSSSTCSVIYIS